MKTRIIKMNSGILWAKVWGIAAMQGAITLTWRIYRLYLPLLLVQLGLAEKLALTLLIVENALEILIEPIFGGLCFHYRFFYLIRGCCFIAYPSSSRTKNSF